MLIDNSLLHLLIIIVDNDDDEYCVYINFAHLLLFQLDLNIIRFHRY